MATTQLRKGILELAILAMLAHEPMYGGQIIEVLSARKGLDSGAGTVYPLLTRLASGKLVDTHWQESTSGPPRKYYTLTDKGRRALEEQRAEWTTLAATMTEVLS